MSRLLRDEEIEAVAQKAFDADDLLRHRVETRGHWEDLAPILLEAQRDLAEREERKAIGVWLEKKVSAGEFTPEGKTMQHCRILSDDIEALRRGEKPGE